jgi:RND superfamily putative drug exporter
VPPTASSWPRHPAALITVSVFVSFRLTGDSLVKMFGLDLAAAIAIDATTVRRLLVPAVVAILGRWLARLLPRARVL